MRTPEKMLAFLRDYYGILGVAPHADQAAIKRAYRRLALRYHPDVARNKRSTRAFLEIQEAYTVLSDPEKRRQYDSLRRDGGQGRVPPSGPRPRVKRTSARPRSGLFKFLLEVPGLLNLGVSVGSSGSSDDRGPTARRVGARPAAGRRTKSRRRPG